MSTTADNIVFTHRTYTVLRSPEGKEPGSGVRRSTLHWLSGGATRPNGLKPVMRRECTNVMQKARRTYKP
ncbi:hypothetical protein ABGV43_22355 [Paenibacillus amylolyticus]